MGLFSDSTHSFSTGDTIGYAFFKIGSTGSFDIDFMESNIGSFINDSQTPNMEVLLTPKGLLLRAKQSIASTTELMASYREIIDLFPNDKSIRRSIQYW
ncbi:MAG: hypothetical protein IPP77_10845 [Bacteroidetes bacterium]|nr:hypothetical protein [Bacteroidota bacterium]